MAAIRARNTKPELILRRGLHARGRRFRLHAGHLPGRPDLVFPGRNAAIFVHGCFWHGHTCHLFKRPVSNGEFWDDKITRNQQRDVEAVAQLRQGGWRVLIVWECAMRGLGRLDENQLFDKVMAWLDSDVGLDSVEGTRF
jgi:DNA mismatch endonuclease (patch repair protein)